MTFTCEWCWFLCNSCLVMILIRDFWRRCAGVWGGWGAGGGGGRKRSRKEKEGRGKTSDSKWCAPTLLVSIGQYQFCTVRTEEGWNPIRARLIATPTAGWDGCNDDGGPDLFGQLQQTQSLSAGFSRRRARRPPPSLFIHVDSQPALRHP
jgi:hypothetical protein